MTVMGLGGKGVRVFKDSRKGSRSRHFPLSLDANVSGQSDGLLVMVIEDSVLVGTRRAVAIPMRKLDDFTRLLDGVVVGVAGLLDDGTGKSPTYHHLACGLVKCRRDRCLASCGVKSACFSGLNKLNIPLKDEDVECFSCVGVGSFLSVNNGYHGD